MDDLERRRLQMVHEQIEGRGITDAAVLRAMRSVPREAFVDAAMADFAYDDAALPIDDGQTISQPFVVATMLQAAEIGAGDKVLEVGIGSGYAAALMAQMASRVYGIERHPRLAQRAGERFEALGIGNIELRVGDGSVGWPDAAPFDVISVAAGAPEVPAALKAQLAIGGRLVMPVGDAHAQQLVQLRRRGADAFEQRTLYAVRFVPLIGEQGWAEGDADV